jgi:chromatin assembly factor 1 subunit B
VYQGEIPPPKNSVTSGTNASSQSTPAPTPTSVFAPPSPFPNGSQHQHRNSASSFTAPSPPPAASFVSARPSSPTRSNSTSSIATQSSTAQGGVITNPPLIVGSVPGIAATNSGKVTGVPITTPPETPRPGGPSTITTTAAGNKRDASESEKEDDKEPKKRRIAPTPVSRESVPEPSAP